VKTAVSLPDSLFDEAERLAEDLDLSRSELYRRALEEYLARHTDERVTRALDKLATEIDTRPDSFLREAARRVLDRTSW
jgi:predicted transcriptional regulator